MTRAPHAAVYRTPSEAWGCDRMLRTRPDRRLPKEALAHRVPIDRVLNDVAEKNGRLVNFAAMAGHIHHMEAALRGEIYAGVLPTLLVVVSGGVSAHEQASLGRLNALTCGDGDASTHADLGRCYFSTPAITAPPPISQ